MSRSLRRSAVRKACERRNGIAKYVPEMHNKTCPYGIRKAWQGTPVCTDNQCSLIQKSLREAERRAYEKAHRFDGMTKAQIRNWKAAMYDIAFGE